mmetsp:Transcript_11225/g.12715  ORF Transcript_11225/g.12715 Transcript_11225/m.12715 type:complete len:92 (-) Transcript_11225:138-413(-)
MPGVITAPAVVPPACKLLRKSDPLGMRRYAATLPFSLRISPFTTRTLVSPSSAFYFVDKNDHYYFLKEINNKFITITYTGNKRLHHNQSLP